MRVSLGQPQDAAAWAWLSCACRVSPCVRVSEDNFSPSASGWAGVVGEARKPPIHVMPASQVHGSAARAPTFPLSHFYPHDLTVTVYYSLKKLKILPHVITTITMYFFNPVTQPSQRPRACSIARSHSQFLSPRFNGNSILWFKKIENITTRDNYDNHVFFWEPRSTTVTTSPTRSIARSH